MSKRTTNSRGRRGKQSPTFASTTTAVGTTGSTTSSLPTTIPRSSMAATRSPESSSSPGPSSSSPTTRPLESLSSSPSSSPSSSFGGSSSVPPPDKKTPPSLLCLAKSDVHLFQRLIDKGDVFEWKSPGVDGTLDLTAFLFPLENGNTSLPNPLFPKSRHYECQRDALMEPLSSDQSGLTFKTNRPPPTLEDTEEALPINIDTLVHIWYYTRVFTICNNAESAMKFLCLTNESIGGVDILDHFDITKLSEDEKCPLNHHRLWNIMNHNFFIRRGPEVKRDFLLLHTQSNLAIEFLRCCKAHESSMPRLIQCKEIFSEDNLVAHMGAYYLQISLETLLITFVHDFMYSHGQSWSRHKDDFI